jgi:hypothetical protein
VVAGYAWRPDVPVALAARPYLHPVRTLAGVPVTELTPVSHPHHLGVSVAVAEIGGGPSEPPPTGNAPAVTIDALATAG